MKNIIENIRKGEIDINNQDLFFSILIKGLLLRLDDDISIRNKSIPHLILHTGDDSVYMNMKGYSYSEDLSNGINDNIYNNIPRCIVNPGSIDLQSDQLSSPYSRGTLQYEHEDGIYSLSGEFRRIPIKMSCELKYYVDSYSDMLNLMQQIISKLAFIRTFNITYMGQMIKCAYQIPTTFEGEHSIDLDGTMTDNKSRILSLSLEIETSYPIWENRTICSNTNIITNPKMGSISENSKTLKNYINIEKNEIS